MKQKSDGRSQSNDWVQDWRTKLNERVKIKEPEWEMEEKKKWLNGMEDEGWERNTLQWVGGVGMSKK